MAAMVIRQPLFGFYSFTGYFSVFHLLQGRSRPLGLAAIAALSAISQTGSFPYDGAGRIALLVAVYVINVAVAGSLTWFAWVGEEQKQRRGHEITALNEANARLEESLRQNADLHEQLVAQARDAGVAEERRRMAREIHDTLAQGLTGIITQLQAAQRAGAEGPGAHHLHTAIDLARQSLTEARRSVHALTPEPLVGARLPDAMREIAGRWSESARCDRRGRRRPVRCASCARRSRSRCCGPPRRRWPTSPSTPARPGSA